MWLYLTFPIVILLAIAAGGGLFVDGLYRNTPYYTVIAIGQDFISLTVVVPVLIIAAFLSYAGSFRARLVWLGALLYLVYSYAIAAFDNQFNSLFLVYVALLGCSLYALIGGLLSANYERAASYFRDRTPVKAVSLYLGTLGILFYGIWLGEVVPALLAGTVPQSIRDIGTPTNAVHVLDMAWILPALEIAAVNLWRKRDVGYLLAGCLLSFTFLLTAAILSMMVFMMRAGHVVQTFQVVLFLAMFGSSLGMLIWYLAFVHPLKSCRFDKALSRSV